MWAKTIGLDGEIYDSKSEADVADWLLTSDIEYEPHKKLPSSRSISDFYLPEYDLWVEYDGLMEVRRDNKLKNKQKFYEDHGFNFLIITRDNWQLDLLEKIAVGD